MSWNINLEVKEDLGYVKAFDIINCTFNLAPMYYKSIKLKEGLRGLNFMAATKAEPILDAAINDMIENSKEYIKLKPKNGWGTYDIAVGVLKRLLRGCKLYPNSRIRVL